MHKNLLSPVELSHPDKLYYPEAKISKLDVAEYGAMLGITLSYSFGLFDGKPLILRYGKWIYITAEKLDKKEVDINFWLLSSWCEASGWHDSRSS